KEALGKVVWRERSKLQLARAPAEQGCALREEQLLHHADRRTAQDELELAPREPPVPGGLETSGEGGIGLDQVRQLVEHQDRRAIDSFEEREEGIGRTERLGGEDGK